MKSRAHSLLASLVAAIASMQIASAATTILVTFDARSETDGDPAPLNSSTTDLGVGPISTDRAFRTYLTFDLTSAPTIGVGDSVELVLVPTSSSANPNESNTSAVEQDFILFTLASDWNGASGSGGGPVGTDIATITLTPPTGNALIGLTFTSAALNTAYSDAVGGNLYLGIRSSAENTSVRSFLYFGSIEDGAANAPYLNVIPEPSAALLGGLGLLGLLRRRRHS